VRKVLIVTYYWPPSGGAGVQRWLKMCKYLPEFGWEPILLVPENACYPVYDATLMQDIASDLKVYTAKILEPYHFLGSNGTQTSNVGVVGKNQKTSLKQKLSMWVRGNFFIPDARMWWKRSAVKKAKQIIALHQPELVITTGPPHSVHLIGQALKKSLGIKWMADFRDPWTSINYLQEFNLSRRAWKKHYNLEKQVLTEADQILTVSKHWAQDFEALGARQVEVITNGYDEADFSHLEEKLPSNEFVIMYTGIITAYRIPHLFFEGLDDYLKENSSSRNIVLRFYGIVDTDAKEAIANYEFLAKHVEYKGYVSHEKLLKCYHEADLFLLLLDQSDNSAGHIPGKLFEYLANQKPILALGNCAGDVNDILTETRSGVVVDYNDKTNIIKQLKAMMQSGTLEHNAVISSYSRRALAQDLALLMLNID